MRKTLVAFAVDEIDRSHLDLRNLPEVLQLALKNVSFDALLAEFVKDVFSSCQRTESLVFDEYHPVDWVLSMMKHMMCHLHSIAVRENPAICLRGSRVDESGTEFRRMTARVNEQKIPKETELRVIIDYFAAVPGDGVEHPAITLNTVLKHCKNAKRLPSVYLHSCATFDLTTILQEEDISGLYFDRCKDTVLLSVNDIPFCSNLRRLSFRNCLIDDNLFRALRSAIQDGRLPNLNHLSFPGCRFETDGILQSFLHLKRRSLSHLDMYDITLTESDMQCVTGVETLSSLVLSSQSFGDEYRSEVTSTMFDHQWIGLASLTLGDVDSCLHNAFLRAVNGKKFPNLTELRILAKYKTDAKRELFEEQAVNVNNYRADELPHLESLALFRMINSPHELIVLADQIVTWKLKELDISYSKGIKGTLNALFVRHFPSLKSLICHNCELNREDLWSLAGAKFDGKLPKLKYLDISYNGMKYPLMHLKYVPVRMNIVEVVWRDVLVRTEVISHEKPIVNEIIVDGIPFQDRLL